MDTVWTGVEIVGMIAFAASGAVMAIRHEFDLFGILVLATITGIGGGLMRDIIIGNIPPLAIRDSSFILICIATALIVSYYCHYIHRFRNLLQFCDALGLGSFTATSANMALIMGWDTLLMVVTVAFITSVGGGILRDILAGEIPLIFHKEVYALAAIVGGGIMYFLHFLLPGNMPLYISFLATVIIRLCCLYWDINLPVVRPRDIHR